MAWIAVAAGFRRPADGDAGFNLEGMSLTEYMRSSPTLRKSPAQAHSEKGGAGRDAANLPKMLEHAPAEFVGLPQEGAGLGARMDQAFEHLFEKGYSPILLRGSDSPGVTVQAMKRFLEALKTHDVVFGPDSNGGYYLIGMHFPEPRMFEVALSNKEVLPRSLEVARGLGLSAKTLEPSFDINTVSDLSFLKLGAEIDEARKSVAFATHHNLWRHLPA